MIARTFPELALGGRRVSQGRTLIETDVVHFCMLIGSWPGLHYDVKLARRTRCSQRLAQGSLIFSIANALLPFDAGVVEAFSPPCC